MFKIHIIGSSSSGNTIIAENDNMILFLDAGMSCKAVDKFMKENNISLEKERYLFVSHEHADHNKYKSNYMSKYDLTLIEHKPEYVLPVFLPL